MASEADEGSGSLSDAQTSSGPHRATSQDADGAIADRIGEWQTRLLQLNRRNNLLYFKPGRSVVGIVGTTPDELDGRLQRSRRGLEFPHVTQAPSRRRGFVIEEDEPEVGEPEVRPGDLATDCEPGDLQRRLRNIRNRDREWEEEQGINVLFLAMGFLNWIDADGEPARSPLVLLPCDLERDSPRDPYRLLREDDDPLSNPTLRHQLALLGVELPDFDVDSDDEASIEGYIADIEKSIGERPGWSVDTGIVLATFSYSKLAMYEDLTRMRERGVRSELTRMLAGGEPENGARLGGTASATPRDSELAGGRLDDLLDIRDQYTVLPTDFSQLRAIEEARRGVNLVIHGPPGTGKSQTISNLIATLIADGKRVLFVSEKTAALDVVKRRLEECGLGAFCLDLHSDRGRKSQVYAQLRSSLSDAREGVAGTVSVDELIEHRDRLNRVVRSLHVRRDPLGLSVYDVQGRFAQLRDLPRFEQFDVPAVASLTPEWIRSAQSEAQRVARRPDEFRDHATSRWRPLRAPQPSLQLAELIREDMDVVQSAVDSLRDVVGPHSVWLGTPEVRSVDDARNLARLLNLLADGPAVPSAWLGRDALARLRHLAGEQEKQQQERERLQDALSAWSIDGPPVGDYRTTAKAVELSPANEEDIEAVVGPGWQTAVGAEPEVLARRTGELWEALDSLDEASKAIAGALAEQELRTLAEVDRALDLTPRILGLDPVPVDWLSEPAIDELERDSNNARSMLEQLSRNEELLGEDFSDAIVDLVDDEMLVRYRTDYQSFWQRLGGAYRRDQRTLRGQLTAPRKLSVDDSLNGVRLAVDVKHQRAQWREMEPDFEARFGARFRGRETDWERVQSDLATLRGVLSDWEGDVAPLRELTAVDADRARRRALEAAYQPLRGARERCCAAAEALGHEAFESPTLELGASRDVVRRAVTPLQQVSKESAWLYGHLVRPPSDLDEFRGIVDGGVRLMAISVEDARLAPRLSQDFGEFFRGDASDWSEVSNALDWTTGFLDTTGGRVSELLRRHATDREPNAAYQERARSVRAAADGFVHSVEVIDKRFRSDSTEWGSWESAALRPLEAWAGDLREHAGEAASWNTYQEAVQGFERLMGAGTADAIRKLTDRSEDVPGIVSRGIYGRWLEEIYDTDPELRAFNRVDHEEVRERFRDLDERFAIAARERVRDRVFAAYPEQHSTPLKAGQLGTLNSELSKRRRQMPVRRLIERIPYVLQALKPCFLMSPLAVSQYLPAGPLESDHFDFDVVIFDEASQVLPEDALPAIERARQAIVVGDRLQLPPTTFFQGGLGDDDDAGDDESDDSFEGRESILDVMVGKVGNGIGERYLSVHYRSQCESLIRFSNHAFYEDRLLTFPGPDPASACVRDEYLPDATYDAGGSRTNRGEAERVTDIVFDLLASRPAEESVGVVALSRAQADLIENLIEERRLLNRNLDDRFSEDLDERFFVKNLENVQGDERDHMILSIGYGPTGIGPVPNRFGPINLEGGKRRLNVAVTRARRSMTVVHALRPEDIRSTAAGARELRRYLEYVRNPDQAIEGEVTGTGEPESPFEEAVLAALRRQGYRLDAQVGVSGYRIDLAIRSEDGDGYDLGIECDGATYHSSPAARDRDWLRQGILERLGWRIHRVWSTAWIRDPQGELDAIDRALERARSPLVVTHPARDADTSGDVARDAPAPATPTHELPATLPADASPNSGQSIERARGRAHGESNEPPVTPALEPPTVASSGHSPNAVELFNEYRYSETGARSGDLRSTAPGELADLIHELVSVEQPVHVDTVIERLRVAFGAGRAGMRMRDHIREAVRHAVAAGSVRYEQGDDAFLRLPGDDGPSLPRHSGGRRIGQIADVELDEALVAVARRTFGSPGEDLIRETARQFGYRRTGPDIAGKLQERIDSLVKSGRLLSQGGMLVAPDNGPGSAATLDDTP